MSKGRFGMKLCRLLVLALVFLSTGAKAQDAGAPPIVLALPQTPADLMQFLQVLPVPPTLVCPPTSPDKQCVFNHRLSGEITTASVNEAIAWLKAVSDAHAAVAMLEINSSGGDFEAGVELAHALEVMHTKVVCVVDGQASSSAFYVLQACDVRVMTKRSCLVAHDPYESYDVTSAKLITRREALNLAEDLRVTARRFSEHVVRRMKVTYKVYRARVSGDRDWHMDWEDAQRFGAVDAVSGYVPTQIFQQLRHGTLISE